MPPLQHVCNGLASTADKSMLARDIRTDNGPTGHSDNVTASTVHSLWRHKNQ